MVQDSSEHSRADFSRKESTPGVFFDCNFAFEGFTYLVALGDTPKQYSEPLVRT